MLHLYTDGAVSKNGQTNSCGGFSVVVLDDDNNLIDLFQGQQAPATNNQMELLAILTAFEMLYKKYSNKTATIYSDSAYCVNSLTSWVYTWEKNNWLNSKKEPVKNLDLILSIYKYYNINSFINQIKIKKVDGHSNIIGNELADALAAKNKNKFCKIITENHINLSKLNEHNFFEKPLPIENFYCKN